MHKLITQETPLQLIEIAVITGLTPRRLLQLGIEKPYAVNSVQKYIESLRKELRSYKHSQPRKKRNLWKQLLEKKPKPSPDDIIIPNLNIMPDNKPTPEQKIVNDETAAAIMRNLNDFIARMRQSASST